MSNPSGLVPLDYRILVKPDEAVTMIGSLHIPQTAADKLKYAGIEAILIAVGSNAFNEWGEGALKPKPGDRVYFAQYSGSRIKGKDGLDYLVMNDKDLTGLFEAPQ